MALPASLPGTCPPRVSSRNPDGRPFLLRGCKVVGGIGDPRGEPGALLAPAENGRPYRGGRPAAS
eukprot:6553948-Alexandrium_andersonii.AAC.1